MTDDGEEGARAKTKKATDKPGKEEVEEHNATHIPFRSWCDHCVRGKCHGEPHYKNKGPRQLDEGKEMIVMNYMQMKSRNDEGKEGDEDNC